MFQTTLLVPPWGGTPVRFAGLTERGIRHLETVGWKLTSEMRAAEPRPWSPTAILILSLTLHPTRPAAA